MSGVTIIRRFFNALRDTFKTNMSIKSTIAAVAASPFLLAGAAFAGPYVNVESNLSYPDGDYSSAATDLHIGYEGSTTDGKIAYYVQGGPSLNHAETTDDTETELSGKVGASYGVSEDLALYGELSGASDGEDSAGDNIVNWGAKLGAKFTF
tara:strand:- start:629 stop:1084 length:456 start_codon:yes stop_codon:yes gene_type:complete